MTMPILYSLQNCPYAIRARLALLLSEQTVQIRAVVMKNKPDEMLAISPKGTVPILLLEEAGETQVIDESLDIMLWALGRNDPNGVLYPQQASALPQMLELIEEYDNEFKPRLEKYKHAKRFHEPSQEYDRRQCEPFVQRLEQRLQQHEFLMGPSAGLLDYALLPFIRQFARVSRQLYSQGPYANLQRWLSYHLQSRLFSKAMTKYPLWLDQREVCLFPE